MPLFMRNIEYTQHRKGSLMRFACNFTNLVGSWPLLVIHYFGISSAALLFYLRRLQTHV